MEKKRDAQKAGRKAALTVECWARHLVATKVEHSEVQKAQHLACSSAVRTEPRSVVRKVERWASRWVVCWVALKAKRTVQTKAVHSACW